jgi:hypothetical protein
MTLEDGTLIAKRLAVAAAIACSAVAALPAAGMAAKPPQGRFIATVKGSQISTWSKPRAFGTHTCFGTSWVEGDGQQTFTFKSKPFKLLIYKSGKSYYFSYNSFKPDNLEYNVHVPIKLTREGDMRHGEDAGDCGGGAPTTSDGPYDCGTKNGIFNASLSDNADQNLELDVGPAIGYPWKGFSTCPLSIGESVSDPWTTLDTPWSPRPLIAAKKTRTITARASFETNQPQPGDTITTTGTTWTLKLKPVR